MENLQACNEILESYTMEELRENFKKSGKEEEYQHRNILIHCEDCEPMAFKDFRDRIRDPEKDRKKTWTEEVYNSYRQVQKGNIRTTVKLTTGQKWCYFCWIDPTELKHRARIYVAWARLGKPLMWKRDFCAKADAKEKLRTLCEDKKDVDPNFEIVDYRLDVLKTEEGWVATVPLTQQGGNGVASNPTPSPEMSNALKNLTTRAQGDSRTPHAENTVVRGSRRSQRLEHKGICMPLEKPKPVKDISQERGRNSQDRKQGHAQSNKREQVDVSKERVSTIELSSLTSSESMSKEVTSPTGKFESIPVKSRSYVKWPEINFGPKWQNFMMGKALAVDENGSTRYYLIWITGDEPNIVYSAWGGMGSIPTCLKQEFYDERAAKTWLRKLYRDKTKVSPKKKVHSPKYKDRTIVLEKKDDLFIPIKALK